MIFPYFFVTFEKNCETISYEQNFLIEGPVRFWLKPKIA